MGVTCARVSATSDAGATEGCAPSVAEARATGVGGARVSGDPAHALVTRAAPTRCVARVGAASDAGATAGGAAGATDVGAAGGGAASAASDAARDSERRFAGRRGLAALLGGEATYLIAPRKDA